MQFGEMLADREAEPGPRMGDLGRRTRLAEGLENMIEIFLGDADAIGNGHVLVTHGSVVDPATDEYSARVIEVERGGGEIVFDLRVLVDERGGWRTYRAEHLDTLYPTDPAAFFPPDPPLP